MTMEVTFDELLASGHCDLPTVEKKLLVES